MRPRARPSSKAAPAALSSPDSGLYLLILSVDSPAGIKVGALGRIEFPPGLYAYCGSARRGLSARLRRHAARRKNRRWHIDYLTSQTKGVDVESAMIFSFDGLTECQLNSRVAASPGARQIPGFGCSDCKCASHLTFLGDERLDKISYYWEDAIHVTL